MSEPSPATLEGEPDAVAAVWREAADTLAGMLAGFPHGGRYTRATWAVEYLRLMANNRDERLRKFAQMAAETAEREPAPDDFAWLDPRAASPVVSLPGDQP